MKYCTCGKAIKFDRSINILMSKTLQKITTVFV